MNEHIIKLADQARSNEPFECSYTKDQWLEKFAELTIRECLGVLKDRYMGDLNREDMEVRRCIQDIQNHFGIKE